MTTNFTEDFDNAKVEAGRFDTDDVLSFGMNCEFIYAEPGEFDKEIEYYRNRMNHKEEVRLSISYIADLSVYEL